MDFKEQDRTIHRNHTLDFGKEKCIHRETNPLYGFHLALAYLPLTDNDPFTYELKGLSGPKRIAASARLEFRQWTVSYRRKLARFRIRFLVGDAIAFSHTLSWKGISKEETAHWPRGPFDPECLALKGSDCHTDHAPVCFDVVDSSSLLDNLDPITLFMAVSPLLRRQASSVLYTELLLSDNDDSTSLLDHLFAENLQAILLFTCLRPVGIWLNTSPRSATDEYRSQRRRRPPPHDRMTFVGKAYDRMRWRIDDHIAVPGTTEKYPLVINFDDDELAELLFRIYQSLFLGPRTATDLRSNGFQYNYASFAALLRFMERRVRSKNRVIYRVIRKIANHTQLNLDQIPVQEILDATVVPVHDFWTWANIFDAAGDQHETLPPKELEWLQMLRERLGLWHSLSETFPPSIWAEFEPFVCLTLDISQPTTTLVREKGLEFFSCVLQHQEWRFSFHTTHVAWGKKTTQGPTDRISFRVFVQKDEPVTDSSHLLISFYAPGALVTFDPEHTNVLLRTHLWPIENSTPNTSKCLTLCKARITDQAIVSISQFAPNQSGYPRIAMSGNSVPAPFINTETVRASPHAGIDAFVNVEPVTVSLHAGIDRPSGNLNRLTALFDFSSKPVEKSFSYASMVSPCHLDFRLAPDGSLKTSLSVIPLPICVRRDLAWPVVMDYTTGVASVSMVVAHPASVWAEHHGLYFLERNGRMLANWTISSVSLDKCPRILPRPMDTEKEATIIHWLRGDVQGGSSSREAPLDGFPELPPHEEDDKEKAPVRNIFKLPQTANEKIRAEFKKSLSSVFLAHASGATGIAVLNAGLFGSAKFVLLIAGLRFDTSTLTMLLDCAVLFLDSEARDKLSSTIKNSAGKKFITSMTNTSRDALKLWQASLPVYVERCRTWEHQSTCEYAQSSVRIPLSRHGRECLCSCGKGQLPGDYPMPDGWEDMRMEATRAAIPATFDGQPDDIDSKAVSGSCAHCQNMKGRSGDGLTDCACQKVQYCSSYCQEQHTSKHLPYCVDEKSRARWATHTMMHG